jgi:hypothetical protein
LVVGKESCKFFSSKLAHKKKERGGWRNTNKKRNEKALEAHNKKVIKH